ncbi:MAG: phage/plasmid primase, P4 family [Oscillospiraceae bacterium]|nr:phage/plasmid primase, P4 family [Oscillospiraceae bacterium]
MEGTYSEQAQAYAALGLRVFPITPGKKSPPMVTDWPQKATTKAAQVKRWWGSMPDANIAVATGSDSGIVDIETDAKGSVSGEDSLTEYADTQLFEIPATWSFRSGSGGIHRLFRNNNPGVGNRAGMLPAVDVRGAGGYAVFPPSLHPNGERYEWLPGCSPEDMPDGPAELPFELFCLIMEGKTGNGQPLEVPEEIQEGGRNDMLFRLACKLRRTGLCEAEILGALQKSNEQRCNPPLENGELELICRQAAKYQAGELPGGEEKPSEVEPPDYSDAGNATVFSRTYKGRLIYVDALGWLWWDGKRWARDDHKATATAIEYTGQMYEDALTRYSAALHHEADIKADPDAGQDTTKQAKARVEAAKVYLRHAQQSRNNNRILNMLALSRPALVMKAEELDSNPLDLNTPAGIVDLKTGDIRPHDPEAYCSQITKAKPSGRGKALWTSFLNTVACADEELIDFLQQVAGMALIGAVYEEGIIIAHGGGRNGKSTFFNALADALGDYSGGIAITTLTTDRGAKGASLATLRGKRLVVTGELEEHQRLSIATLKQLGSTDKLTIEEKYHAPETITQSHTLCLFTNHLPRVGSTDGGTWRRLTVIPFNATIEAAAGVQNYAEVLAQKANGAILSWAIAGAVKFCRNGYKLDKPQAVERVTQDYREREDWLGNFINERCIREPTARVRAGVLYTEYQEWAAKAGDYVRRLNDFSTAMETAGFQKISPKNKKTYIGLRIDYGQEFENPCGATG